MAVGGEGPKQHESEEEFFHHPTYQPVVSVNGYSFKRSFGVMIEYELSPSIVSDPFGVTTIGAPEEASPT